MTELAIPDSGHAVEPTSNGYRGIALSRLGEWAESARAAHQVALSLCKTSFVPEAFRDKPEETTAAILAGAEVGLTPMAAIRSFDIIQGVAAPRALTLRAIVQSMGHQMIVDESTATRCIVRVRRRGETEWQKVVWTMDRAKHLGLATKPNYRTQSQTMLVARATSEGARLVAADAILGIAYSAEEIGDGEIPTAIAEPPPSSKGRRMSLPKPAPIQDSEDGYDENAGDSPNHRPAEAGAVKNAGAEPSTPSDGRNLAPAGSAQQENTAPALPAITRSQLTKLHLVFSKLDYHDRDDRLRAASTIVGRKLGSSTELLKDEASALIDTLETLATRDALEDLLAQVTLQETFDAEIVEDKG